MPRTDKVAVVERVRDDLTNSAATLLTEYRGLTVDALAELRTELRKVGASYFVVKNTLAKLAARDAGFAELDALLTGPTALAFCADDPVGPAKAIRKFAKTHPELVVKGGVLEGAVLDAAAADRLADLASREELLTQLAGLMYGALANAASLLQAPLSKLARLMAALEAKQAEDAPAPAPAAAAPEPEPEPDAEAPEPDAAAEPEAPASEDAPTDIAPAEGTTEDTAPAGAADDQ